MTVFGASALLLAAIGIYGPLAYSVAQRTQEIGIRIALRAESEQVRRMVVLQGMRPAIAGVVLGLGAAWGSTRLMASVLFGVEARDPAVFVVVRWCRQSSRCSRCGCPRGARARSAR